LWHRPHCTGFIGGILGEVVLKREDGGKCLWRLEMGVKGGEWGVLKREGGGGISGLGGWMDWRRSAVDWRG
jgi:hypothetical protein